MKLHSKGFPPETMGALYQEYGKLTDKSSKVNDEFGFTVFGTDDKRYVGIRVDRGEGVTILVIRGDRAFAIHTQKDSVK